MTKGEKVANAMRLRWALATEEEKRRMGKKTADDPAEFWRRVNKNGPLHPMLGTNCWVWTGVTRGGYGRFRIKGKFFSAHVHSYEMARGKFPDGMKVLHRCDNPSCVRPDHLFIGTQYMNVLDSVRKGRHRSPVMVGSSNPSWIDGRRARVKS